MSKLVRVILQSEYFREVFIMPSSPFKTALSITVGFYLAISPLPGTVTLLCILTSFLFRLNLVLLQGMNWLFTPLQLFLLYPFMKAGRFLLFNDTKVLPSVSTKNLLDVSPETLIHLVESVAGGILVWGLLSLTTGFFIFRVLLNILPKEK